MSRTTIAWLIAYVGMLKKAATGVLTILPCSRTESTLRAPKGLRPCWTNFFEHSLRLMSRFHDEDLWAFDVKYSTVPMWVGR